MNRKAFTRLTSQFSNLKPGGRVGNFVPRPVQYPAWKPSRVEEPARGAGVQIGGGDRIPSYSEAVLADNPVAYWRLGEKSGTQAVDASGNGHDGTYQGNPTLGVPGLLTGDPDTAVQFDGVDDHVEVPHSESFNLQQLSLEAWVRPDLSSNGGIIEKTIGGAVNTQYLLFQEGPLWRFRIQKGEYVSVDVNSNSPAGVRTHLVGTFDGTDLRLYVNGVLAGTLNSPGAIHTGTGVLRIGYLNALDFQFEGTIDEVALYAHALSPDRIRAHFVLGSRASLPVRL